MLCGPLIAPEDRTRDGHPVWIDPDEPAACGADSDAANHTAAIDVAHHPAAAAPESFPPVVGCLPAHMIGDVLVVQLFSCGCEAVTIDTEGSDFQTLRITVHTEENIHQSLNSACRRSPIRRAFRLGDDTFFSGAVGFYARALVQATLPHGHSWLGCRAGGGTRPPGIDMSCALAADARQ